MIKLAISGAHGRMGQAIERLAFADNNINVTTLLEYSGHPKANEAINGIKISTDNSALEGCDALIEFTLPEATIQNLEACVKYNVRMVIGTTGLTADQIEKVKNASRKIPIVFSSNMSVGVNILFKLIEIAGKKIGAQTIKLSETHHIHKKDAPSGTAKTMAQFASDASKIQIKDEEIEAIREGEVIGDHTITFETPEDVLTIYHHAKARDMFAKGALAAAKFLQDKKSGLYNMQDVLGLNEISIK